MNYEHIARVLPNFIGGAADLSSGKSLIWRYFGEGQFLRFIRRVCVSAQLTRLFVPNQRAVSKSCPRTHLLAWRR